MTRPSAAFPRRTEARRSAAALCRILLCVCVAPALLRAGEGDREPVVHSVVVDQADPDDAWFSATDAEGDASLSVPANMLALVGEFAPEDFVLTDLSHIRAVAPDGTRLPVTVASESVFEDFDGVVSLDICVRAPVETTGSASPFRVEWGPGVDAETKTVERFRFAPEARERVRGFSVRTEAAPPDANVATIDIVADSSADWYFLWYLLPMAALFILLVIRKASA